MSTESEFDYTQLATDIREAVKRPDVETVLGRILASVRPEDIAEILPDLSDEDRKRVLEVLNPPEAGRVISELDEGTLGEIAETSPEEVAEAVREMEPDDASEVLSELSEEQTESILEQLPPSDLPQLKQIMKHPDNSAGSIMTTKFILLWKGLVASEALKITQKAGEQETGAHLFVADQDDALVGYLPLRRLVFAKPDAMLSGLMTEDVIAVSPETDQEEVLRLATKYNLDVVPVADAGKRLIGVITSDDLLEVMEEEANEDMYLMAGMDEEQNPVREGLLKRTRVRLPWLLISLLGGIGSAFAVRYFDVTISRYHQVVFFMPLIALMGGNVAIQASTLVVRGLATGDIPSGRLRRFFFHEMLVNFILAAFCGLGAGIISLIIVPENALLGVAVASAIASAVIVAGGLGMAVPILCHKLGIDPAVSAGPFVTIINDISCVTIYFHLVGVFLKIG